MPPDFEELPLPKKQQNTDQDINDLKVLIHHQYHVIMLQQPFLLLPHP